MERRKSTNDMVSLNFLLFSFYLVVSIQFIWLSLLIFLSASLLSLQVFIYGGVGPLHSDVTVAGVAKAFGVRLVCNIYFLFIPHRSQNVWDNSPLAYLHFACRFSWLNNHFLCLYLKAIHWPNIFFILFCTLVAGSWWRVWRISEAYNWWKMHWG